MQPEGQTHACGGGGACKAAKLMEKRYDEEDYGPLIARKLKRHLYRVAT